MDEFGPKEIAGQMPDPNAGLKPLVMELLRNSNMYTTEESSVFEPGEKMTRDYPGSPDSIEVTGIATFEVDPEDIVKVTSQGFTVEQIKEFLQNMKIEETFPGDDTEVSLEEFRSIEELEDGWFDIVFGAYWGYGGQVPSHSWRTRQEQVRREHKKSPEYYDDTRD